MIGHIKYGSGARGVVMLHGWLTDHTVFEPILPFLPLDEFSLLAIDQRGYGLSHGRAGPYDVATVASDTANLVESYGWEDYIVVGHSMGGKVGLRMALDYPRNVSALVGITPVWAGAASFDETTTQLFAAAETDEDARIAILRHSTSNRHSASWYRNQAQHSFLASSTEAFGAYFQSWSREDFAAEAQTLKLPVEIIVGRHDLGIPEEAIRMSWCAGLPHAGLHVISSVGHYPMLEDPMAAGRLLSYLIKRTHATKHV